MKTICYPPKDKLGKVFPRLMVERQRGVDVTINRVR